METLTTMPLAIDDRAGKPHPRPLSEERGERNVRDWRVVIGKT